MAFDYDFYGEGLKRRERGDVPLDTEVTALVMKDCKTSSLWAHTAACKKPKDQWLMRSMQLIRDERNALRGQLHSSGVRPTYTSISTGSTCTFRAVICLHRFWGGALAGVSADAVLVLASAQT